MDNDRCLSTCPTSNLLVNRGWQFALSAVEKNTRLLIASWNARTFTDDKESTRPERRTPLIINYFATELILQHRAKPGLLIKASPPKRGYTFWKGKPGNDYRMHRFVLTSKQNWLMKLRSPLTPSRHNAIVCAYAPTITSGKEVKRTQTNSFFLVISVPVLAAITRIGRAYKGEIVLRK